MIRRTNWGLSSQNLQMLIKIKKISNTKTKDLNLKKDVKLEKNRMLM